MNSRLLWAVVGAGGLWFLFKMMKEAKQILPQQPQALPHDDPWAGIPDAGLSIMTVREPQPWTFDHLQMLATQAQETPDLSQWVDEGSELAQQIWGYSGSPTAQHVNYKGSH